MKLFKKAVLVIHGFSAGLYDNEYLVNTLELNNKFDVYAWTLPAHDKPVINKVKYADWVNAVDAQINYLIKNGYHSIYVVGHSMGGVLAGYLASKYSQIKKVVFLSAAYDYISISQYKEDFKSIKALTNSEASYKNFFHKIFKVPISTAMEFRKLIKNYRNCLTKVNCKVLALQGDKDEVVPYTTLEYIKKHINSNNCTFTNVKDGRHVLVKGKSKEKVIKYIETFLIGGIKWKQMKKSEI